MLWFLVTMVSSCKRHLLSVLYQEFELVEGGDCQSQSSSQLLSLQSKINVVPVNSLPVSMAFVAWFLVLGVIIFSIICCHCLCWFTSPGSLPSDDPHVFHLSPRPSSPSEYLSPCAHKTSTSCAPSEFLIWFSVLSSARLCPSILVLSPCLPCPCILLSFKPFLCFWL